jgi:hypothetical protein
MVNYCFSVLYAEKRTSGLFLKKPRKLALINHNPLFLKGFIDEFISA